MGFWSNLEAATKSDKWVSFDTQSMPTEFLLSKYNFKLFIWLVRHGTIFVICGRSSLACSKLYKVGQVFNDRYPVFKEIYHHFSSKIGYAKSSVHHITKSRTKVINNKVCHIYFSFYSKALVEDKFFGCD